MYTAIPSGRFNVVDNSKLARHTYLDLTHVTSEHNLPKQKAGRTGILVREIQWPPFFQSSHPTRNCVSCLEKVHVALQSYLVQQSMCISYSKFSSILLFVVHVLGLIAQC